jgi:GTP-binding protein
VKVYSAEIEASAARVADLPPPGPPEIAFLGRSNVGKSSLLNRLAGRKRLARTSSTPGKTRLLHVYRVEGDGRSLRLVDLPGYGWAKVSKTERRRWRDLVESYLGTRGSLHLAVLLQDLRRDPSEDEHELLEWLAQRGIPTRVVITKTDKLKPMRRKERLRVLRDALGLPTAQVIATSAQTGDGIADLWRAIRVVVAEG